MDPGPILLGAALVVTVLVVALIWVSLSSGRRRPE
jgi:hypothetical protein